VYSKFWICIPLI